MSYRVPPRRVENYTNPFLGIMALIFFMGLWVIGAFGGFLWIALTTAGIDLVIKWVGRRPGSGARDHGGGCV